MTAALGVLVGLLGLVLRHWATAGIENGDHDQRAWATVVGPVVAIAGAAAALVGVIAQ